MLNMKEVILEDGGRNSCASASRVPSSNRIEFIDCAKGLCILLVVYHHAVSYISYALPFDHILQSFRMPLYFILSGLFFKPYGSFLEFLVKKINRLLIPFFFFFIVCSIILPLVLKGTSLISYNISLESISNSLIEEDFFNLPIWFLLCLFNTNILYYAINCLLFKSKRRTFLIGIVCLALGIVGYKLAEYQVNVPFYIDSTLVSIPFFFCGHVLKGASLVKGKSIDNKLITFVEVLIIIGVLYLCARPTNFESNNYDSSFVSLYICGVLGTIFVFLISKLVYKLPIMSNINILGKYSIITLCTHILLLGPLSKIFGLFIANEGLKLLVLVVSVCVIEIYIIVPLLRKYFPYFTAQKDLIKFHK